MSELLHGLGSVADVIGWILVSYFIVVNALFAVLLALAARRLTHVVRSRGVSIAEQTFANPFSLPVSVVMPMYNEASVVVDSVSALRCLRYPQHEVVVVDDGSTDGSFEALRCTFDLVEVPALIPTLVPVRGAVRSLHVSRRRGVPLTVVRKDNGGRADALNCGLNAARHTLVCLTDADSILDPDALLLLARPFTDDPMRVIGVGAAVRPVNGSVVRSGRVVQPRIPRTQLERMQAVEYLRAFQLGRAGWSQMQALALISGTFGMYRTDIVVEAGGYDPDTSGEDLELTVALHRYLREQGRGYRIAFVPEPVVWTEVPATLRTLARQRRRWHRGLGQVIAKHRGMLFNAAYGRIGMLTVPWMLLVDFIMPISELAGVSYLLVILALIVLFVVTGTLAFNPFVAVLFTVLGVGYSVLLTAASVAFEEAAFRRYRRGSDVARLLLTAATEPFWYRPLYAWWRLRGMLDALFRTKTAGDDMQRVGLTDAGGSAALGHP